MAAERSQHLVRFEHRAVVERRSCTAPLRATRAADTRSRISTPGLTQPRRDLLAGERLLALEQPIAAVNERHLRAELRPRLRHLGTDDAAAENREPPGSRLRCRRLYVRPRAGLGQTGDRRHEWRRSGRDHDRAPRDERLVADANPPLTLEFAAATHERDIARVEPRDLT